MSGKFPCPPRDLQRSGQHSTLNCSDSRADQGKECARAADIRGINVPMSRHWQAGQKHDCRDEPLHRLPLFTASCLLLTPSDSNVALFKKVRTAAANTAHPTATPPAPPG